jgi:ribosomal 50S subunit-recycling heat shock protein
MQDQQQPKKQVSVNEQLKPDPQGQNPSEQPSLPVYPQVEDRHLRKERKQMRLDKLLKVSRIIKRRQTAKEVSDAGKISVNEKVAKSSTPLKVGDEITLHYATKTLVIRVLQIKDSTKKEDASQMYEIVREEVVSNSN